MKTGSIRKSLGIIVLAAACGINILAQDRNEVIRAYNEGAKVAQTDPKAAIVSFENVITLADKVGESAADLRQKAEKVLPGLYLKVAVNAMNEKKPAADVVLASRKAAASADKYGSAANKENAQKLLVQAYNNLAVDYFNKKEYDNALKTCDSLLLISPDNSTAISNKALIYLAQGNSDAFEKTTDQFIEKMKNEKDTVKASQASVKALEYFRASGSKAAQANKLDEALVQLNKAAKYGDDKDLFYYFADVYNKQKNFDKGLEYAQKGLALEAGNNEAKAKFHYQTAVAQAGKGQTAEACASFKNAMFGPFAEASKAQRTNLKCQ
jgi:tetratricopeptide (TPR) repeat protein